MRKRAIVLFNLGGPDSLEAVRPFLFNLFFDPAIIGAPLPIRWALARFISTRRAPIAREIYSHIGGKSPLLEETRAQGDALVAELAPMDPDMETKAFICMRYWHPMTAEAVTQVKNWAPDEIVLLPLYPQYSGTTSGSSLGLWDTEAKRQGLTVPSKTVCCYPTEDGFITAIADLVSQAIERVSPQGKPRVLFSAHGLPKKVVAAGDPYQWHVEQTAAAIVDKLAIADLDWQICYQSRVGPLEWIGPSTDDEIHRGGADGVPLIVVPVAFVSEHSETLVELDIEYRKLADSVKVPVYDRVSTVGVHPDFIKGLATLVRGAETGPAPLSQTRLCPSSFGKCPCRS